MIYPSSPETMIWGWTLRLTSPSGVLGLNCGQKGSCGLMIALNWTIWILGLVMKYGKPEMLEST